MAIFIIPKEYEVGLAGLLSLSDSSVKELLSALESVSPSVRYKSLADRVAPKVSSIPKDELEDVIEVLFSLSSIRTAAEVPTDVFVADICEAVNESGSPLLEEASSRCDSFKRNFAQLLECKTLEIASKAGMLLREHAQTYCSARILSDIRPIFGESVEAVPIAATVVHTLKVAYHQGDELKDFFLAMSTKDVRKLRELLDRADAKAESLKTFTVASNTPFVDAE